MLRNLFSALAAVSLAVSTPAIAQSGPPVKMSKNYICHPKGGTYYNQTKNYTPFKSMAECIRAGGRPPKR
jgi:hypothetical protein